MKQNHTHKFKRHTYKTGTQIYMCVLDCNFRVNCELALGKKAICWRCGKEFTMNTYSLTLAKPHCESCHVFKETRSVGDRRKHSERRAEEHNQMIQKPSEVIASTVGDSVISNLRERLTSVIESVENSNTPKIIEYTIPDEEDVI